MGALGYWKLFEQVGDASLTLLYFSERSRKMKAYCVIKTVCDEDYFRSVTTTSLECIFSNKEKAYEYCKKHIEELSKKDINELEFDDLLECEWKSEHGEEYFCSIFKILNKDGEVLGYRFYDSYEEETTTYFIEEQEVLD